jgi:hypothetical protein
MVALTVRWCVRWGFRWFQSFFLLFFFLIKYLYKYHLWFFKLCYFFIFFFLHCIILLYIFLLRWKKKKKNSCYKPCSLIFWIKDMETSRRVLSPPISCQNYLNSKYYLDSGVGQVLLKSLLFNPCIYVCMKTSTYF